MRKSRLNLAVVVWSALLAGVLILWCGSYRPELSRSAHRRLEAGEQLVHGRTYLGSSDGKVTVVRVRRCRGGWNRGSPAGGGLGVSWDSWPVHTRSERGTYYRIDTLNVSYAWPASALALVNVIAWCRRRRGRDAIDMCEVCGYDLRATPQRCPECGNAAAA
jgi:hypothetical protein